LRNEQDSEEAPQPLSGRGDSQNEAASSDNSGKKPRRKRRSAAKRAFLGALIFLLLLAGGFAIWLKSGWGGDFLDNKIEAKLQQKIGSFANVDIENARLSLDDDYHIALKVDNTPIKPHNGNIELSRLGRLRFGFATMPLLRRQIEVIQLEADTASVIYHQPDDGRGFFASLPHDGQQRVDFDAVAGQVFAGIEKLVAVADKTKINTFRFRNIDFTIKSPQSEQHFTVEQFQLQRLRESAQIKAQISWLGRPISIEASAALDAAGKVQNFTAAAENIPVRLGADDQATPYLINGRPNSGFFRLRGLADLALSGRADERAPGQAKELAARLRLKNAHSDISIEAGIATDLSLNAVYARGSGRIKFEESALSLGGLKLPLEGQFGYAEPKAEEAAGEIAAAESPVLPQSSEAETVAKADDEIARKIAQDAQREQSAGRQGADSALPPAEAAAQAAAAARDAAPEMPANAAAEDAPAAAPAPILKADSGPQPGLYSFTLESEAAVSSPASSPAPALPFSLHIDGLFSAPQRKINVDSLVLRSADSGLLGQGSIRFGAQRWPEIILLLHSPHIAVDAAKQLWPIDIAHSARAWVLSHIFGGELRNARIELALPEGFYQKGQLPLPLTEEQLRLHADIANARSDLVGTLPPLRAAYGAVDVRGRQTIINLEKAVAYVDDGRSVSLSNGVMSFENIPGKRVWADLAVDIAGKVGPIGKILACEPLHAADKVPFNMQTATANIRGRLNMRFPLSKARKPVQIKWDTKLSFTDFSLAEPYNGSIHIADGSGHAEVDKETVTINGNAMLNGIPASISLLYPLADLEKKAAGGAEETGGASVPAAAANAGAEAEAAALPPRQEKIVFHIDDKLRNKLFPALDLFLKGPASVNVGLEAGGARPVSADLTNAAVQIPWIGWRKGAGIAATATMRLPITAEGLKNADINDFVLSGAGFRIAGRIHLRKGAFSAAEFSQFTLNRSDKMGLSVSHNGKAYQVKINGNSFDMRALIKSLGESAAAGSSSAAGGGIALTAALDKAQGFNNEVLNNVRVTFNRASGGNETLRVTAVSKAGKAVWLQSVRQRGAQRIQLRTADAGAVLRFMNYYDKVQGGAMEADLQSAGPGVLSGPVRLRNFAIVNESKLAAIVSAGKDKNGKANAGYLAVEHGFGRLTKGPNSLSLTKGIIRGPSVGASFQGVIYDASGNIAMTGTYMPAYSVNRIFGDVPVLGTILGNGRDKGLIGITFKIEGKFKSPKVVVNPISAIAPGVLRSMFEFKQ